MDRRDEGRPPLTGSARRASPWPSSRPRRSFPARRPHLGPPARFLLPPPARRPPRSPPPHFLLLSRARRRFAPPLSAQPCPAAAARRPRGSGRSPLRSLPGAARPGGRRSQARAGPKPRVPIVIRAAAILKLFFPSRAELRINRRSFLGGGRRHGAPRVTSREGRRSQPIERRGGAKGRGQGVGGESAWQGAGCGAFKRHGKKRGGAKTAQPIGTAEGGSMW